MGNYMKMSDNISLGLSILKTYIKPIEPAVNPIIRKNENSAKSRGKEFTIILS